MRGFHSQQAGSGDTGGGDAGNQSIMEIIRVEPEPVIVRLLQRVGIWSLLHAFFVEIVGTFSATPGGL